MLEAPNAEMCDLCSLCPKDVTLESMDLSDRVRITPRAVGTLWYEVTDELVARCVGL